MNTEELVEMTPSGKAAVLAQQLLEVAADPDNTYRIEDVKTTTAGPRGLAFLVPAGLYDIWNFTVNGISPEVSVPETELDDETEEAAKPRSRARKTATAGKE